MKVKLQFECFLLLIKHLNLLLLNPIIFINDLGQIIDISEDCENIWLSLSLIIYLKTPDEFFY
jgi:hypothetical protein